MLVASIDANLRCPGGAYTLEKEEKEGREERKKKKGPFPCLCLATYKKAQPGIWVGYEGIGLNTSILHLEDSILKTSQPLA